MPLWSEEDLLKEESRPPLAPRVLAILAGILVLGIASGTIYGFATGSRAKKLEHEADRAQVAVDLAGRTAYTGIGTVRSKSADDKPAVVVATISFPYDSGDRPFAEELERKSGVLKAVSISVLGSRKATDLAPAYEGSLKAALRDAFNARLSLGKVSEIWLSDFAVIQ
jgi:Flagellar basal body-associated protein FliL.